MLFLKLISSDGEWMALRALARHSEGGEIRTEAHHAHLAAFDTHGSQSGAAQHLAVRESGSYGGEADGSLDGSRWRSVRAEPDGLWLHVIIL